MSDVVNRIRRRETLGLFFVYLIMFWSDFSTFRPGMDAMTYGALAKHILSRGDWATLHYTDQAYSNFYQHPPLAIWMMAISMKLFGSTEDWVLKVLPSLMGGACAIGVYLWGRRLRGEWFAFVATLILLTSTRFVKYSKGFMLDPFLAAFSLWAVYLACRARTSSRGPTLALFSGLLVAAAFLSKGLFAFAPFAVSAIALGTDRRVSRKNWLPLALFAVGVAAPFALWFVHGNAAHYLARYYSEHVADRIGPHPFRDHLGPLLNLVKVYWPWLPFFVIGIYRIAKSIRKDARREEVAIALTALAFVGGFCLVASFLEQYHTATYPFAAIVAAIGLPAGLERYRIPILRGAFLIVVAIGIFMIARPHAMRGTEYKNPIRIALKEARVRCKDPAIRRIAISTGVAEIWYALAIGSWNTDWDVRSVSPAEMFGAKHADLLLTTDREAPGKEWVLSGIAISDYRLYRRAGVICQ